jgi:probable F420-dependent oxidoreductase
VDLRVSVQASPTDRSSWARFARELDTSGFHALYAADHPGSAPSPFVALAAAAGVTERIRLGTCVVNAGMWEPLALASAVATLDVVSDGRAIFGAGAGHTPDEWESIGREFPSAADRVGRMIELVTATQELLRGRTTSYSGRYVTLVDAVLQAPRPVQHRMPLLVGGNGERLLRFAARQADIAGISGLGRTLAGGHHHEVDWHSDAIRRQLAIISSESHDARRDPEIEALVQVVEITDDARIAAERIVPFISGASVDDLLGSPFAWIGSVDEISDNLRQWAELGIHNYVIRSGAVRAARRIMGAMR